MRATPLSPFGELVREGGDAWLALVGGAYLAMLAVQQPG